MAELGLYGSVSALIIGIVLGLIGGGGSILTVPVLVYLLNINPVTATAYSLFIVGTTSLVGAFRNAQNKMIVYNIAILFSIPSFIGVFFTRKYIIPNLPDIFFIIKDIPFTKEMFIMLFFSILLVFSAYFLIKEKRYVINQSYKKNVFIIIVLEGLIIGVFTGIVGAGGGFLIVPALVLLLNIPMKKAVATSLLIISIKSLLGFIGDLTSIEIDWELLVFFTLISIIGIVLGVFLNKYVNEIKLKKGFGYFLLIMSFYIVLKEIL